MELSEARAKLEHLEPRLSDGVMCLFAEFDTPYCPLQLFVTSRFRRKCRKGKVWKSPGMLVTMKNAIYGLSPTAARSRGGSDGIFLVDRKFKPPNAMMRKLFDQFIDRRDPLVVQLAEELDSPVESWLAVRLVSHHMRLLGILVRRDSMDQLVLVDYDDQK